MKELNHDHGRRCRPWRPFFGTLGGFIASGHTGDPAFLLLGAIGSMRMFLELLFKRGFSTFLAAGTAGRAVHFALVAFAPELLRMML